MFVVHTPSVKQAVLRLYRRGASLRTIQETTGVADQTIRRWRAAAGIPARPPRGPDGYSADFRRRAVELYANGRTSERVAAALGCSPEAVTHWARRAGIRRPARAPTPRTDAATIDSAIRLYRRGTPLALITQATGLDRHTVRYHAALAGIPPRTGNHRHNREDHR